MNPRTPVHLRLAALVLLQLSHSLEGCTTPFCMFRSTGRSITIRKPWFDTRLNSLQVPNTVGYILYLSWVVVQSIKAKGSETGLGGITML